MGPTDYASIRRWNEVYARKEERRRWHRDPVRYFMELHGWRPETLEEKGLNRRLALVATAVDSGRVTPGCGLAAAEAILGRVPATQRYTASVLVRHGAPFTEVVAALRGQR